MFQDHAVPAAEGRERRRHAPLGPAAARLCEALQHGDVIAIACDEQRAEAIARAASQMAPDALVLLLPPSDAVPGEDAPASPAVAGKRVAALAALRARDRPVLLVTDASAASRKVAPPERFGRAIALETGATLNGEAFTSALEEFGYFADERVDEAGEYAVRGSAIDLFPADADQPVRIHLEGGRIREIDSYDPVSQRGEDEPLQRLILRPVLEPDAGSDAVPLFDHLPGAALAIDPEAEERRRRFRDLMEEAGGSEGLVSAQQWSAALKERHSIDIAENGERPGRRFVELRRPERAFLTAVREAREDGDRIVLTGSARDVRFLVRQIERRIGEAPERIASWTTVVTAKRGALLALVAEVDRGWTAPGVMVIAAADVLGARASEGGRGASIDPLTQEVTEIHIGDAVIHEDHGLGLLRGVETIATDGAEVDAIRIEYAAESQRLVPVEEAGRLWRYGADPDAVSLDRLDGSSWTKRRRDIDKDIAATARQLIKLAAARVGQAAPVLEPPVADYERFSAGFPYAETRDQLRAIEAVRDDLASGKPMDRLVVGDVGYGKTEVALRAAAIAALAGKQVALIAPTTVLVRQHIETFRKRFARTGIQVAGLSRLSSASEARAVKKGLTDGSVRMVIGTTAIAGKTVRFADLGLVVIDEEQRFGAADKKKLRALSEGVHVLTLTATPIPRTLQTALVGLQELSLITTPPARRLPIRTSVASFAADLVRPALLRERRRGGQSFVVVPRIEDLEPMAERLRKLAPDLSLRQAHGKMPVAQMDEEMVRFAAGDGDILLATNIIEAGLDIPRANTMIVWRPDMFGLAQLHQLRGRVGRSRVRGTLLLLTEGDAEIAPATMKRLRTMEALDQLGAGFAISARDLDLRGAGELLGEEQAGHMKLIGLGLYQHLLEQAIRTARGECVDEWLPEINLGLAGRIPSSWIPEEEVRINLYLRLARIGSGAELGAFAEELEDRFGALPPETATLIAVARVRQLARMAGVERVDAGPAAIAFTPRRKKDFPGKAAGLVRKNGRFLLQERIEEAARLERVHEQLEALLPEDDPQL